MKGTLMRYNFNGGELSPYLDGRVDFPKYQSGAKEMTNFIPTVYGPMTKRPGTIFVEDLTEEAVLYPFEFSEAQAYIFAFKESEIAIYTGDGRLLDGVTPVTIPAFYTLAQAKELKFAQAGDLLYFVHPTAGIYKISRTAVDTFIGSQVETKDGPFQDENPDEDITITTTTVNATTVTFTCTNAIFSNDSIGASVQIGYVPATEMDTWFSESGTYAVNDLIQYQGRIYQVTAGTGATGVRPPLHEKGSKSDGNLTLIYVSNGYGYAKITAVGGNPSTTATATIINNFPPNIVDGAATDEWAWSAFGGSFGWPAAIVFHQQRMVLGGSLQQPQTIWGSETGDIESFSEGLADNQAYEFTIAANKKNPIEWLASNIVLEIGTLGGEFTASSTGPAIAPTDIGIKQIGQYGSADNTAPLIANGFTVFNQAGGRKLRELRFDDTSQRNFARDLNKVSEHIVDPGIKMMAYQAEPYQIIWTIIGTELYALTYETDEDVYAWSRQSVGEVSSIATIPNGGNDRLWMVVKRNGNYYIEYLSKFFRRTDNLDDAVFTDSSLSYSGPEVQNLTGLDHLEGETLQILNEGSVGSPQVVSGGAIMLQYPTTKVTVGLPIESAWQSMRFEGGAQDSVGQGKSKKVSAVVFRLEKTGAGLKYGKGTIDKTFSNGLSAQLPVRETTDDMDAPPSLLDGDTYRQPIDGGSDQQYMLRVEHSEPVPCTIISIILTVDTTQ
jgi:hypothetical protein